MEVLPAWVSRHYTLSGRDWAVPFHQYLLERGLLPPPQEGYFLQDSETGTRMTYDVKLRLTREVMTKFPLNQAAEMLGLANCPICLPASFTKSPVRALDERSDEHLGSREGALKRDKLSFLGRWTPRDSVDDYARAST